MAAQSRAVTALVNDSLLQQQPNSPASRSSTSLVTAAVTSLSDPPVRQVSRNVYELLTRELVTVLIATTSTTRTSSADLSSQSTQPLQPPPPPPHSPSLALSQRATQPPPPPSPSPSPSNEEAVRTRIESMGFQVGWSLAERLARDRPRFPSTPAPPPQTPTPVTPAPHLDTLEVVKFVCKDVWITLFDKQVDNLRTNRRGTYVLLDNTFKPVSRPSVNSSSSPSQEADLARTVRFSLAFPCGIIRGALANLGITSTVTAESPNPPQTTFQINTTKP